MNRLATSLACTIALLGCGDTPTASSERVSDLAPSFQVQGAGTWVEYDITTYDSCNDEYVELNLRRQLREWQREDGAGGRHVGIHRTLMGTGVGLTTGTKYVLNYPLVRQLHAREPYPYTETISDNLRLVTKGSAQNIIFKVRAHVTVNANGRVVVEEGEVTLTCRG